MPLYKIWEILCDKKKYFYDITDHDKKNIYDSIKSAMDEYKNEIYLYNLKNPYQIKEWLENEHHLKCCVYKKQIINGTIKNGYIDTHYCYVTWY